jgi:radical SAM superfamily enzyme YgiQ (UPF0313 family)
MIDFRQFKRPQRYIGNEWNVVKKANFQKIKICISFPDLYEVGMSHLGLRIVYGILNKYSDVVCERVFMPDFDLLDFLKNEKIKLFSLETKTPLDEFEVLGFNFNYELNFTNFLSILDRGGIPLSWEKRKDLIVIGGGISNPEPLADFVDLFCLGEFEVVADKFVRILRKNKDKESRLKALSKIEGFYVPKLHQGTKSSLNRVYVKNLDKSYFPDKWLTPHTEIVQDRVPIEIARGCPNSCKFCQAQGLYFPYRQRKVSTIKRLVKKIYKNSGYQKFSFLALSASDYSRLDELLDETVSYFDKNRISLSFPSLRPSEALCRLYKRMKSSQKASLTVAVEAATESLRKAMNKKVDISKVFEAAKIISSLGLRHMKVYLMFGFPGEKEADLAAIGKFLERLSRQSRLKVNASINIFIPKPFSAWEGVAMEDEVSLRQKREFILKNIPRSNRIKVSFSSLKRSILEAVVSRADRKFSRVIYRAYQNGAIFQGENASFSWDIWEKAMEEENIDYRDYLKGGEGRFPWSFIK